MMQCKGKAICLAVMLTVMLPVIAAAQPAVPVWGEWNQDQTISGCIEIQNTKTLTIAAGVTVSFEEGAKLIVRNGGTLVVNPTSAGCPDQVAGVLFTRTGTIGGWDGIVVENGGAATLNYVDITYATDTGLKIMSGGAVGTMNHLNISNCSGSSGGGLYTEANVTIINGSFVQNSAGLYGGGIEAVGATVTLQDVWLEGNIAGYSGGAIDILSGTLAMLRGRVQGNDSPSGSGIALYNSGGTVSNVFFNNNQNEDGDDGAVITRIGNSALALYYNTFRDNMDLASLQGDRDANVLVAACIMWDNGASNVILAPSGGTPSIQASDIQNLASLPGNWLGAGNIDADPLFVADNDYNVDDSSPVIGSAAGQDMGVTGGASAPGPNVGLINLPGTALANPYDVGTALLGTPIVRNVRLRNSGQEAVEVVSAVITGAQAGAFSVALTPGTLAPGACLDVQITFAPPAPGSYTFADLMIVHSAGVLVNGLMGDTQEGTGSNLVFNPVTDVVKDFGSVLVDTMSLPQSVTIVNPVANGGLVEVDLAAEGDVDVFTLSETNFMIPSGGSRTIWVTFEPGAVRSYEAIVTPTVNDVERADLGILLLGQGTELLFSVAPSEHQFAPTQVGITNASPLTVTVTNLVASTSILVTAVQPGSGFTVVPASAPIAAAGTANFTVNFAPGSEGFVQADLDFSCTLGDNDQTETVELRGIGIPTGVGIVVAPSLLNFADTSVGDTSSALAFTVTNVLNDFVIVDVTSPATAEFDLVSAGSFVLFPSPDPRATRSVFLTMSPSAASLFSDSVTVTGVLDGTAINVGTSVVALQGRGTDSVLDIAPDAIDYLDVEVFTTSSTVSVSVVLIGTEPVTIFAGLLDNEVDFVIVSESCSTLSPLDPAGGIVECFYEVAATPQTEGAVTGELAIYSSDVALPTIIELDANGTPAAAAVMSVDPTTIDMGDVAVFISSLAAPGLATVTITNSGTSADLIVSGITFNGYHAAQFTAIPVGAYPRTIVPGASEDVQVRLQATGIGVRATTMTIASNAGPEDVTITGVSQVGYPNSVSFGWDPNGQGVSVVYARDEDVYVVPGIAVPFYIQQVTALTAYLVPCDNFIWMEGPAFLQYMDNTGTWQTAATEADIESASIGATLSLIGAGLITAPAPVGEGLYTLHVGFDLVRDNSISEYDVHYVDSTRNVVFGPKPTAFVDDTALVVGDPAPVLLGGNWINFGGTSTIVVDAYILAQDPTGTTRWLDGVGVWNTGTPGRLASVAVNVLGPVFGGVGGPVWTGYPITDASMVGTHTITVVLDRSANDVLDDQLFTATETITVTAP
jgi:hypothetical protein